MTHKDTKDLQKLPVGRLGILSPYSCAELGAKVDNYLVQWRKGKLTQQHSAIAFEGYERDTYLVKSELPRFRRSEGHYSGICSRRRSVHSGRRM